MVDGVWIRYLEPHHATGVIVPARIGDNRSAESAELNQTVLDVLRRRHSLALVRRAESPFLDRVEFLIRVSASLGVRDIRAVVARGWQSLPRRHVEHGRGIVAVAAAVVTAVEHVLRREDERAIVFREPRLDVSVRDYPGGAHVPA